MRLERLNSGIGAGSLLVSRFASSGTRRLGLDGLAPKAPAGGDGDICGAEWFGPAGSGLEAGSGLGVGSGSEAGSGLGVGNG